MSRRLFALVLLAAAGGAAALAAEPTRLLAPDGGVVEVRQAVLPAIEGATSPPAEALAVTLARPGAVPVGEVVPGTEGAAAESLVDATLSYGGTKLTVFWVGREGGELRLSARTRDIELPGWSEQRELIAFDLVPGAPEPIWTLTRDQYTLAAEDGSSPVRHERDVLHFFWWAMLEGRPSLRYAPVVLVDGRPLGAVPSFALDALDSASVYAAPLTSRLFQSLAVVRNGDEPRLGVTFLSPASGRLLGVELQLLPGELSVLADRARGHIIDLSAQLHPASAQFAADGIKSFVEGFDTVAGLNALADRARGHIIDLVATPLRGGIATEAAATSAELFEIPELGPDGNPQLSHLLRARVLRSWAFPVETVGSEFVSLVSPRGDAAILAWRAQPETLIYLESGSEGFGESRQVPLGSIDLDAALSTLRARLATR